MILWSKTKAEIPEPKTVALSRPESAVRLKASNKDMVEDYRRMLRRRWAEANPILYDGIKSNPIFSTKKRVEKVQGVFYRTINWGRFSRFLRNSNKESIIKRLIKFTSVKVPHVAGYSARRKKNRNIKISGPCVACGASAHVVHHIIMIVNGGPNIRRNTVPLFGARLHHPQPVFQAGAAHAGGPVPEGHPQIQAMAGHPRGADSAQ